MIRKIAFIGGRDIHTLGGIENYMLNLSAKLVQQGYDVTVYCESNCHNTTIENGVKIVRWKSFGKNLIDKPLLGLFSTLHAIFINRNVDLIHYNAWPPSLWSWIPSVFFGKKTLMQGHGLEWQRTKYTAKQQKIMRFMERFTAHLNRNLIMVSQDQTDFFMKEYGRKCVTITPGIPEPEMVSNKTSESVMQKYGLKDGKYFLYLGRLVQDKNPDVLIRSFLSLDLPDYKLVIAGNNPSNPDYVAHLKDLAAGRPDVIFTDAVFGETKFSLISHAFAYCIPSSLEGLPISLLECMSYARYCIASDIPGCREALGGNGVFVPLSCLETGFASAMRRAVEESQELPRIGFLNKERAMKLFSWDTIAQKYIAYINDL